MMTSPPGHRESSVPRNKIVTVSSLDTPRLKDRAFGTSVDIDNGNMYVSDLIVVLVSSGSDFGSSDKDIFDSSCFVASLNVVSQSRSMYWGLAQSRSVLGLGVDALCHLPNVSQAILLSQQGRMGAIPCQMCQLPQVWPRYLGNTDGPPFTLRFAVNTWIIGGYAIVPASAVIAGILLSVSCLPVRMELRGQTRTRKEMESGVLSSMN